MKSVQWIYNILDKTAETDKIIHEDLSDKEDGFLLIPDYTYNSETDEVEKLHVIALVARRDIRSLRDLNETHLKLLLKVQRESLGAICKKYKVSKNEIRAYVHYLPTYFHFHVHFSHVNKEERSLQCEKAHSFNEIIQNIQLVGSYYQKATLEYALRDTDPLFEVYKEAKIIA
jgi:m7GpppX diphosphatase